jgi:hypothetical protein
MGLPVQMVLPVPLVLPGLMVLPALMVRLGQLVLRATLVRPVLPVLMVLLGPMALKVRLVQLGRRARLVLLGHRVRWVTPEPPAQPEPTVSRVSLARLEPTESSGLRAIAVRSARRVRPGLPESRALKVPSEPLVRRATPELREQTQRLQVRLGLRVQLGLPETPGQRVIPVQPVPPEPSAARQW